ncbi:Rossmann-like and DUF2520 domain-containing protein [Sphingobacterium suaedae]|uniref:Rossmann-like and DUF2520 domain-containing protein n=1 Tax=Sphingobacterium suaedae TaxID=1686402 RepID=A0ABW5KJN2_9SPHI
MNIVIIGSGNVATQLGKAFQQAGHTILQVYSRTQANAIALASLLHTDPVHDLRLLNEQADLYLLAVSDQAIAEVATQLPQNIQGIVVHSSGATDISILRRFSAYGVIYPPQSINKQIEVSLQQVPFGIEGNNSAVAKKLLHLIQDISTKPFSCTSEQRLALHTAAVFANNFTNALFDISYQILKDHALPFDLLKPIIAQTAENVQHHTPASVQTGPAKRKDQQTMNKHLQFLSEKPRWIKIYQQLSEEIASKDVP